MKWGLFNKGIVTIYGVPDYDHIENLTSTIQDEGLYGMLVEILEYVDRDWVKIRTHYRYEGYVPIKDLFLLNESQKSSWERNEENKRIIEKPYIDVLACAKVQGIILASLTRGAIVTLLAYEPEGWARIRLNDGREGYVKENVLGAFYSKPSSKQEDCLRKKIVQTALSYLDSPYKWGGKSPLGIDCSGLTSMAYLLNGIVIYRDAKIKDGFPIHSIEFKDRKLADLFYFPGHVAMYIGNDHYIHATAHNGYDGVVINSIQPKSPIYRADLMESLYAVGSYF